MDYKVSDVYELFEKAGINPKRIKQVTHVWGDIVGDWLGGVCFVSKDGEYFKVTNTKLVTSLDQPFQPEDDDYSEDPPDINTWINDGASPEEVYSY